MPRTAEQRRAQKEYRREYKRLQMRERRERKKEFVEEYVDERCPESENKAKWKRQKREEIDEAYKKRGLRELCKVRMRKEKNLFL